MWLCFGWHVGSESLSHLEHIAVALTALSRTRGENTMPACSPRANITPRTRIDISDLNKHTAECRHKEANICDRRVLHLPCVWSVYVKSSTSQFKFWLQTVVPWSIKASLCFEKKNPFPLSHFFKKSCHDTLSLDSQTWLGVSLVSATVWVDPGDTSTPGTVWNIHPTFLTIVLGTRRPLITCEYSPVQYSFIHIPCFTLYTRVIWCA